MKVEAVAVEMSTRLILGEREIKMLAYLAGFGGKQIGEAITKELTKEFSKEEWEILWSNLRSTLESATERFRYTRAVFQGQSVAVDPNRLKELQDKVK